MHRVVLPLPDVVLASIRVCPIAVTLLHAAHHDVVSFFSNETSTRARNSIRNSPRAKGPLEISPCSLDLYLYSTVVLRSTNKRARIVWHLVVCFDNEPRVVGMQFGTGLVGRRNLLLRLVVHKQTNVVCPCTACCFEFICGNERGFVSVGEHPAVGSAIQQTNHRLPSWTMNNRRSSMETIPEHRTTTNNSDLSW